MSQLDVASARYLISGSVALTAYGPVDWSEVNGVWRGRVQVAGPEDLGQVHIEVNHRPRIPWMPTIVLLVNGRDIWRVDVNGQHKREPRVTHLQMGAGYAEYYRPLPGFLSVAVGTQLGEHMLRRIVQEAAKVLSIDASAMDWSDPDGGEE